MLPFDILRLISLQLEPYKLSICKDLHNLYNDNWYEDKLNMFYPSLKSDNYKDLYKKYLKQGDIYVDDGSSSKKLLSQGIKVSSCDVGELILTFDGNLFNEFDGKQTLIDKNVIDINCNSYIKEYEWFIIEGEDKIKFNITPKTPFIKVFMGNSLFCALTYNGIYYFGGSKDQINFFSIDGIIDAYLESDLFILDRNNVAHHLYQCSDGNLRYDYKNYKIILGKGIYDNENNPIIFCFEQGGFTKLKDLKLVNNHPPNEINKHILCIGETLLITKHNDKVNIYTYLSDNDRVIEGVKDIFGCSYQWCYIK